MAPGVEAVESASERGARVTRQLIAAAALFDLEAVTEFAIPGGRIDVVWLWQPPSFLPGVETELPLVGFEVESSWRSRKHIKGDLVNLQDLRPLVGVIVLLGEGAEVESTRRFASQLVDRPDARIVVWSEEDVAALVSVRTDDLDVVAETPMLQPTSALDGAVPEHTGKYRPMWEWLCRQQTSPVTTTFLAMEKVLGFALPPSCRRHLPHWYGYSGTAVGRAIRDAGWRARHVDLEAEIVIFERAGADLKRMLRSSP